MYYDYTRDCRRDESCCCRCRGSVEHVDMLSRGNKKEDKGLEWNGGGSLCATAHNDRQSVVARKIAKAYWGSSGKLKSRKTRRFVQSNSLLYSRYYWRQRKVSEEQFYVQENIFVIASLRSQEFLREEDFYISENTFMTCKCVLSWMWCRLKRDVTNLSLKK